MDLVSYSAEDLSSLRPNDYFFDPSSRKIYQYRNKEGKAIIVRELGTPNITKLFKNVLKTVLKVESDFDKYQVINMSDTSITLFNINIGESFELGFGDASDSIEEMRNAFNKGEEIVAEVFDYDDVREIIKLSIANTSTSQAADEAQEAQLSEAELKRIKEIEEKKAKKRPFGSSGPAKTSPKTLKPTPKTQPKETKKEAVKEKVSSKKPAKKVEGPTNEQTKKEVVKEKVSSKKPEKKVQVPVKEESKKETKEEKKEREKREKEEQKEREKREKEEKKAREKAEKEAKKGNKGKK